METPPAAEVERKWIPKDSGPRFLSTDNSIRLELQAIIRAEFSKGNHMQPHESARQFLHRTQAMPLQGETAANPSLYEKYEYARYRAEEFDFSMAGWYE